MSSLYANRFVVCASNFETTLEFQFEEPIFNAEMTKVTSTELTPVAKITIPKATAHLLVQSLLDVLNDTQK